MLNFVAKHYRKIVGAILWINLFSCVILGGVLGNNIDRHEGGVVVGIYFGFVVGLFTSVFFGGLVAVFLNIDRGVKNINKWLQCMWQHSNNINKEATAGFISDDDIHYFDCNDRL
jgi:hypothetical protein